MQRKLLRFILLFIPYAFNHTDVSSSLVLSYKFFGELDSSLKSIAFILFTKPIILLLRNPVFNPKRLYTFVAFSIGVLLAVYFDVISLKKDINVTLVIKIKMQFLSSNKTICRLELNSNFHFAITPRLFVTSILII